MTFDNGISGFIGGLPTAAHSPDLHIGDEAGEKRLRWWCGEIVVRGEACVTDRDGLLCISRGAPRFTDPRIAAIARNECTATAWLALFESHAANAPAQVRGRFGVAILDRREGKAFLATDRFATEPWCFAVSGGRLALSDRADRVPCDRRTVSADAIYSYLFHHVIPAPLTIFEEVSRLEGGACLQFEAGMATMRRWWTPVFNEPASTDFGEAKARFLEIVEQSVAREAEGKAVGAFLSGGTDSSTVAGMLCKVTGAPAETYSIGFDASGYDEMEYARTASKHFGTRHHEYYVTPQDLVEGMPRVAKHYDQPFGNSSAVPAWLCARMAQADGINKLLAGDGGDELFGGNSRYAKQRVFGWYDQFPGVLRKSLLEPVLEMPASRRLPILRKAASYVEQARVPMPDRMHMYNLLVRLGPSTLLEPDFLDKVDTGAPMRAHRDVWQRAGGATGELNRTLAFDWKYTLADNDLPKILGTTALAGVDVGFPLLSDELLDFSLDLPRHFKLKGFKLRWFFKEALRGFLPDAIITKKKHGFGLPFGVWACQHETLRGLAGDTLAAFAQRGIVRPAFVRELMDKLLPEHPGYYGELVWILTMLELWLAQAERQRA